MSFDKFKSVYSLVAGQRAMHFDALLPRFPGAAELPAVIEEVWRLRMEKFRLENPGKKDSDAEIEKPDIRHIVTDLDGTLVSPYASITDDDLEPLLAHQSEGRSVGIYTNSPHTDRLDIFRDNGIAIAENGIGKPAYEGFKLFCKQQKMDRAHTAMIGNSAITDMPLVPKGQKPFFPLNILTESIPPHRQHVESMVKHWRASLFHWICLASAKVVLHKNPDILREINNLPHAA